MNSILKNITDTIIETVMPKAIILFGSSMNFELKPGSDLDICVLVEERVGLRDISRKLYKKLVYSPIPIDILVENFESFKLKSKSNSMIYKDISQGIMLYESK